MIILYSYPQLFGVPDNNPFGLKVDTYLRIAQIPYQQKYIIDTKNVPRGQLPCIDDEGEIISDSNNIISYLTKKYNILLDQNVTQAQKDIHFLVMRMLDNHLYWVMSYSRWQDERFWPLFKNEFLKEVADLSESGLENAKKYNLEKYYRQGISRYSAEEIYQSGIEDLQVINRLLGDKDYLLDKEIHSIDACCYGYLANIYYFDIDTPLKKFINSKCELVSYIHRIREKLNY